MTDILQTATSETVRAEFVDMLIRDWLGTNVPLDHLDLFDAGNPRQGRLM